MSRSQPVVSVYYDAKQDRLMFVLTTSKQEQVEGIITRRLLKAMLTQLPGWLAKQGAVKQQQSQERVFTSVQQHAINQFQYLAAEHQAVPLSHKTVTLNKEIESFFVETVSLSSVFKQDNCFDIAIKLLSADKLHHISVVLTLEQFHQFVLVVLEKTSDWDLSNPWLTVELNSTKVVH